MIKELLAATYRTQVGLVRKTGYAYTFDPGSGISVSSEHKYVMIGTNQSLEDKIIYLSWALGILAQETRGVGKVKGRRAWKLGKQFLLGTEVYEELRGRFKYLKAVELSKEVEIGVT